MSYDDYEYDNIESQIQELNDIGIATDGVPDVTIRNMHEILCLIHTPDVPPVWREILRQMLRNIEMGEIDHRDDLLSKLRNAKINGEFSDSQAAIKWASDNL